MTGRELLLSETEKTKNYDAYVGLYKEFHRQNAEQGGKGYIGRSVLKQLTAIRDVCRAAGAKTLLDYGCGRGEQYSWRNFTSGKLLIKSLQDYFEVQRVGLFDPAVPAHQTRPVEMFDVVICTDVLEHVPETDVSWVLKDIASFARKRIFLSIASYKAGAILANGENAHVTIKSIGWWEGRLKEALADRPELTVHVVLKHKIRIYKKFKLKWNRTIKIVGNAST